MSHSTSAARRFTSWRSRNWQASTATVTTQPFAAIVPGSPYGVFTKLEPGLPTRIIIGALAPKIIALGQATETETAQPATRIKTRRVGDGLSSISETFNKADGALGPNLAPWTRRVFSHSHPLVVASNRGRLTATETGTFEDLQEPFLTVDDPNASASVEIPTANNVGGSGDFVADGAGVFRFALISGDTDYRGYAFGFGLNNVFFPAVTTYHLAVFRIDGVGNGTLLRIALAAPANVTLPATLTAYMIGNRFYAKVTHGGPGPALEIDALDSTYTDGKVAWGGSVQVPGADTCTVEFDNWTVTSPAPTRETETAQHIAAGHQRTLGQAVETETAQPIKRAPVVGLALETETAFGIARAKTRAIGQATETETGQAVAPTKLRLVGQALETETAFTIARTKLRLANQAAETETAFTVAHTKLRAVGQAVETETAQPIRLLGVIGQVLETETAQALTRTKTRAVGQSSETETASAVTRLKVRLIAQALETETAQPISLTIIGLTQPDELLLTAITPDLALTTTPDTLTLTALE